MHVFVHIEDFASRLAEKGALMGLDVGTKRTGIAFSDARRNIASAYGQQDSERFQPTAAALLSLSAQRQAAGFVIGLPLHMNGGESPSSQRARTFARNLAQRTSLPLLLWDERLSSVAAERALLEADITRTHRARLLDRLAAAWMLQGALDGLAHLAQRERAREAWPRREADSPCKGICVVHEEEGLCVGCWRTVGEIASWGNLVPAERRAICEALPAREAAAKARRRARRRRR